MKLEVAVKGESDYINASWIDVRVIRARQSKDLGCWKCFCFSVCLFVCVVVVGLQQDWCIYSMSGYVAVGGWLEDPLNQIIIFPNLPFQLICVNKVLGVEKRSNKYVAQLLHCNF